MFWPKVFWLHVLSNRSDTERRTLGGCQNIADTWQQRTDGLGQGVWYPYIPISKKRYLPSESPFWWIDIPISQHKQKSYIPVPVTNIHLFLVISQYPDLVYPSPRPRAWKMTVSIKGMRPLYHSSWNVYTENPQFWFTLFIKYFLDILTWMCMYP